MTGMTTEEIAERLGLDKQDAYNLVRGLLIVNACKKVGTRPGPNGKGKGTNLYAFAPDAGAIVDRALQGFFGGSPIATKNQTTAGYITSIKTQGQERVKPEGTPAPEASSEEAEEHEETHVLGDDSHMVAGNFPSLPEEEPPPARCDVFLLSVGSNKLKIFSMLRNDLALDLKEAMALTSDLPKILCSDQPKEWAEAFQAKLVAAGAVVELRDA